MSLVLWGRIRMTNKCFFFLLFPFLLLTAEKFVLHKGQKHNIRRMLITQLAGFIHGLGRNETHRRVVVILKKLRGVFAYICQVDE